MCALRVFCEMCVCVLCVYFEICVCALCVLEFEQLIDFCTVYSLV